MAYENVRRKAALKVLGLTEADLELQDDSEFLDSLMEVNKDLKKVRDEVRERKCELLRKEVQRTANGLSDEEVEQIISVSRAGRNVKSHFGSGMSDGNSRMLATAPELGAGDLMAPELQKIEMYREKKKAELQDSLNEEMRKKQDAAARQVKAAADVKRLEEIKKQQAMTIAGDAKEREAKHASRKDALRRANLARDERMQEFEKKLNEADERVSNQLAKNASDLASRIGDKYEKGQYALRRKHEHEQEMFQHAIHRMDLRKEKEESVNSLMERKREDMQEKANENRSKFLQRLMQVQSNREKQESDNSAAHYSSVKKHESVRANHEERLKGFSAELHQKLDKGHQMAKKNLDRQNAEKEGIRKELEKKIRDEAAASAENASKYQLQVQAEVQRRSASRQIITDVVHDNQRRLKRAQEYNSHQTLAKVVSDVGRVDEMLEQRRQIVLARVNAQREAMIERHKMERAFDQVKDGTPARVAAVLKSLGMDVKTGEGDGKEDADPKK